MRKVLRDQSLRDKMIARGLERAKDFSWDKCARQGLQRNRGASVHYPLLGREVDDGGCEGGVEAGRRTGLCP